MTTEPYEELGGLEHPGPYDQSGAKFRQCPTCGAKPMTKCTFWQTGYVRGKGMVRTLTARHMPCLARITNQSKTEGTPS